MNLTTLSACFAAALAFTSTAQAAPDAPYQRRPDLDTRVFACASEPTHTVLSSKSSVEDALKAAAKLCDPANFKGLRKAFVASLNKKPVDWETQSLVIVQDWFGTGMAKATLDLATKDPDAVRATIKWKVPPPPVTADTATCRFAFTVQRSRVASVEVVGRSAEIAVLQIAR